MKNLSHTSFYQRTTEQKWCDRCGKRTQFAMQCLRTNQKVRNAFLSKQKTKKLSLLSLLLKGIEPNLQKSQLRSRGKRVKFNVQQYNVFFLF